MQSKAKKDNVFKRFLSIRGMGQVISVTGALILLSVVFAIINNSFFSGKNIANLLRQIAPIMIIGMGQSFVLITGGIDLSIGSVIGMSAMMSATMMTRNVHAWIALPVTILCCMLVGLLNGTLISRAKLPPFIATLGTMIMVRGIAQIVNGNINTDTIEKEVLQNGAATFRDLFYYGDALKWVRNLFQREDVFQLFMPIVIALVLFLIFNFVLSMSKTGRHIYAIGSNFEAAKFSGVNVQWAQTKAYIFSSFLAGMTGLITMAQSGTGMMDAGNGNELFAVAASVIGGVSTMGGQGLLIGTVIGSFIWGVLQNGLQFAKAPQALKNITIGAVVIIAVLIDRVARGGAINLRALFGGKKVNVNKLD